MPFAGYDDFDDCVAHNQDKGSGKEAYCAEIMHRTASPSCGGEKAIKSECPNCPDCGYAMQYGFNDKEA